jgi:hypothetical protein
MNNRQGYGTDWAWPILTLFLLLGLNVRAQFEHSAVLYGEDKSINLGTESDRSRVFLDKNGHFYPHHDILNAELLASGSSLQQWCFDHPLKFRASAQIYGLGAPAYSDAAFAEWQSLIIDSLARQINRETRFRPVINILIHGFRKPFKVDSTENRRYSHADNLKVLAEILPEVKDNYYIEVYWDGGFAEFSVYRPKKLLAMFEFYARPNAVKTGYQLRLLISELKTDTLRIMSHSTGAVAHLSLLCNAYQDLCNPAQKNWATPNQSCIQNCFLAAALGAADFQNYYHRNTRINFKEDDNYRCLILYNPLDFVLLKKDFLFMRFGYDPRKYGNTALGANYDGEIAQLDDIFKKQFGKSLYRAEQISNTAKSHHFYHYAASLNFANWLQEGCTLP